ncbi:MAG: TonB-dependent receptor [FCB group bacterium]|nr:TonB-dependent receptor [FCB group bacterium]
MRSHQLFTIVFLSFLASILIAGTTGKIKGRVTDKYGQPLPGANVVIQNTTYGAAADKNGTFYILNIPPGTYTVNVMMIGYKTVRFEGVTVQTDLTTTLNAELEETVLESEEEITVIASRPMVLMDATASASIITSDMIDDSPIETFQAIVQTKAGVSVDAGGALHFRGGRSDEITYLVDGIPNINPYNNGLGVDIATNAIQELSVITGAFSAEYGQAMSGIINIVTKNPGPQYHGSLSLMSGDLMTNYNVDINPLIQKQAQKFDFLNSREIEATLSGPVPFFKKLRVFTSLRQLNEQGYLYGLDRYTPYGVEKDSSEWKPFPMNPNRKTNFQAKFTYSLTKKVKLQYNFFSENRFWKSYSHSRKYLKEGHYQNFKTAINHTLKLTHQLGMKNFYTLSYSHAENNYKYYAYKDPNDKRYVWSSVGYYVRDANYEFYTGGTNNGRYDRRVVTDLVTGQFTSQVNDQHEVKAGFEGRFHNIYLHTWRLLVDRRDEPWIDANGNNIYDEGEEFTDLDGNGEWSSAKDDNNNGIYGDIIVPEEGPSNSAYRRKPVELSLFVQDKIELKDLVINMGLRWDYYNTDGYVAKDWSNPNPKEVKPASIKTQISPRFSIAYPITDRGKLFFSYGHFFQMPPYYRLYTNPDFDILPGVIKSDVGNADLKPQKTVSYEVGFEQEVTRDAAVYVKVFYRDMRNLLGQRIYILPGGSDSYALFINRDWGNVKGVTLSFDQRFTGLVSGSIDYTYQVAVGNESDPTRTRRDYRLTIEPQKKVVYLNWDQPHAFRFVLNIGRPGNWRISSIGRIESGYPYTPKDANALIRVAEENSGRKPSQINVDVNAYKNFKIAGINYRLFIKVYNLFDRRNENYVWDSSGRAGYSLGRFGDESTPEWINRPNWYSKPRQIYMGVAIDL